MGDGGSQRLGASLLIGGSGCGKTTSLEQRAIELLGDGARGVTMIARNRVAARRSRLAISRAVGATDALNVTTIHALALSIIAQGWKITDATREPALLSGPEQFALVQAILDEPEERARWTARFPRASRLVSFARELREFVLRAQDADESPEQLAERATFTGRDDLSEAAAFYRRYLDRIAARGMVDHPAAVRFAADLVTPNAADDRDRSLARTHLIERSRSAAEHLLIDDLQSTTPAMLRLLAAVANPDGSVRAAYDPDAPSFGFRGSSDAADVLFEARFWPVDRVPLTTRVRPEPTRTSHRFPHAADERATIVHELRRAHGDLKIAWGEIAIIVRRLGPEVAALRRVLDRARIPVSVIGENRAITAEPALQPLLDLATCAFEIADREAVIPRVLAWPMFGVDSFGLRELRTFARHAGVDGLSGLLAAPPAELHASHREPLLRLNALIRELADLDLSAARPDDVWWWLWETLPHFADLVRDNDAAGLDAIAGFSASISKSADRHPGLRFSELLAAMTASDFGAESWTAVEEQRPDTVRILTVFGALGREFDLVIVPGCVDGTFPSNRERAPMLDLRDLVAPADAVARRRERIRQEERVFNAVIASARQRLILTCTSDAVPSPLAERAGCSFTDPVPEPPETLFTRDEFEARQRRILCSVHASDAERDEALRVVARLRGVEPDGWWYEQGWTRTDPAIRTEPFKSSPSRLDTYENCPLQYLYQQEAMLDQSTSHYLDVGNWVHAVVERAALAKLDGTPASFEQLLAWLDELWDPTRFDNVAIEHRRRIESERMIERWFKHEANHPIAAVEASFAFEVGNATVRGRIDRIDSCAGGGSRVIDYKTGGSALSEQETAESLQLATYALAIERDPELHRFAPVRAVTLSYLGVARWGRDSNLPYARPTHKPEEGYIDASATRLRGLIDGITEGRFAPSGEAECRNCKMKTLCPLWPQGDEVAL